MSPILPGVLSGVGLTFLVVASGAVGRVAGIVTERTVRELTRVAIGLLLPCFMFEKVLRDFSWHRVADYGVIIASSAAMLTAGLALGWAACRALGVEGRPRRLAMALAAFNNSLNIPVPLAMALLPPDEASAVIVMFTLYNLVWSPLLWSLGVWLVAADEPRERGGWRRAMMSPPGLAVVLGVLCRTPLLEGAATHPSLALIHQAITWVGEAAIPICLVILGGILAGTAQRRRFDRRVLAVAVLVKLVALPALALAALRLIPGADPLLALAIIIQASSPPATNLVIISEHYGGDVDTAGAVIFLTYLLSLVTFVVWIGLAV